jgi:hypothetical protein
MKFTVIIVSIAAGALKHGKELKRLVYYLECDEADDQRRRSE